MPATPIVPLLQVVFEVRNQIAWALIAIFSWSLADVLFIVYS